MKNKVFKIWILMGLSTVFLTSCGLLETRYSKSFPQKTTAKKTNKKDQQTWKSLQKQKNIPFKKRVEGLTAFIEANIDKEIALSAYMLKAKLFSLKKKSKQACLTYHQVVSSPYDYTNSWTAFRNSAKCYWRGGQKQKALETLERFIQSSKQSLKKKKLSAKLQWDFSKNKKSFIQWQLTSLSHLVELSPKVKEKQKWMEEGQKLIISISSENLIRLAEKASLFNVFEGFLLFKAGEFFWENKELSKAKKYFNKSLSSSLDLKLKKLAEKNLNRIKKISTVNPYLIGVLVPLSGRRKVLGEKILRGLYMGLDMDKDSPWQIAVMDSKSHPDVVTSQLENLLYKQNVIAIIGGLTSETAEIIAKETEDFATPTILFSQKTDLNLNREFIFQNAVTPDRVLEPLVNQARSGLKIEKIGILYPDDAYGKEYARLFSEVFEESEGEIVKSEMYKTGEVDFKKHIKNLLDLNIEDREEEFEELKEKFLKENPSLSARSRELTPENLLPPRQEWTALFIPDSLKRLKVIVDHLRYFSVKDIYLLGTDLWQKSLKFRVREKLPLVFVNSVEKNNELAKKSLFYKEFIKSYGRAPGLFEQRAYNSAVFLKQALQKTSNHSRLSLWKELKQTKTFQGAFYEISVSEDKVFRYPLAVYKKDSKSVNKLDPMPVK